MNKKYFLLFVLFVFSFTTTIGLPLRSFGGIGAGAEDYCGGFLYADSADAYQGSYFRIVIQLRPERDPEWACSDITSLDFRLSYDDTLFSYYNTYNSGTIIDGWTVNVTPGVGYIDVSASGSAVTPTFSEKNQMLRVYFTPQSGVTIGQEYDFTLSNISVGGLSSGVSPRDAKVYITESPFSGDSLDRSNVSKDSRCRLAITGNGFSPYTDAKLEYNGSTTAECQTFHTIGVQNHGTDTLYAMFDLSDTCTGSYSLYLGRRGGDYENVGVYQDIDTALDITVDDDTESSFFLDKTSTVGLDNIDDSMGLAVGDYNNDGYQDLFICRSSSAGGSKLYRNNGNGTFTDVTATYGFGVSATAATWADIDNDGDLDLLLNETMYRNNSAGSSFSDITSTAFPGFDTGKNMNQHAWADYDNDGDLDVFMARANSFEDNELWNNSGSGVFSEVASTAGILGATDYETIGCAWGDYNNDGYMDLFLCNGPPMSAEPYANSLYSNDGDGTFTRLTNTELQDHHSSNGVVWVDYDNDGWMDIHVVNSPNWFWDDSREDFLFNNNGDGTFSNVAVEKGVHNIRDSFGVSWADWDLYTAQTPLTATYGDWNQLNRQTGTSNFFTDDLARKISSGLPATTPPDSHTCVWFDYDNDGDLDYVMTGAAASSDLILMQNRYRDMYGTKRYLEVKLEGRSSNSFGVGARIEVTEGSNTYTRYITAGDGYLKEDGLVAHFGLGYIGATVDEVHVYWPSGAESVLYEESTDQILTIVEPITVPGDYGTIQAAIDAASGGDTIQVQEGTYSENIDTGGKAIHLVGEYGPCKETIIDGGGTGNVVYIHSGESGNTIIEGFVIQNGEHGFYISSSSSPTVKNCVIRNNNGTASGTGMYMSGGSPTVVNCVFHGNATTSTGSAIYAISSTPTITNNTIYGNDSGNNYGAVRFWNCGGANFYNNIVSGNYGRGITAGSSCPTLDYNNVWNNEISDYYFTDGCAAGVNDISVDPGFEDAPGGRFYLQSTSLCIGQGTNSAPGLPDRDFEKDYRTVGTVDIGADEYDCDTLAVPSLFSTIQDALDNSGRGDTVLVSDGTYYENVIMPCHDVTVSSVNGPDLAILDGTNAGSVVSFSDNQGRYSVLEGFTLTNGNAALGGGVYIGDSSPTVMQNRMENNSCTNGGGVYIAGSQAYPLIVNNIITGNSASNKGGGIYVATDGSGVIVNNTVDSNTDNGTGGVRLFNAVDVEIHNNIITNQTNGYGIACSGSTATVDYNNIWNNPSGTITGCTGTNTLSADPEFISTGSDYHISASSPVIDAGNNAALEAPAVDYDDDARPYDGDCDGTAAIDMGADEAAYSTSAPGGGTTAAVDDDTCDDTGVVVSWGAPSDGWGDNGNGTRSYEVYRGATPIYTASEGETGHTDFGGTNNVSYTYKVRAINGCGDYTDYATDSATDTVPAAPGGGTTTATDDDNCDDTGVLISWGAPSGGWNDNGIGSRTFEVYRGAALISTKSSAVYSHFDSSGTNNTIYTYKIVAVNGCGLTTDYTTDNEADYVPSAPGGGTTSATDDDFCDDTGVNVTWAAPSGGWGDNGIGTRSFEIYRGASLIYTATEAETAYLDTLGTNNTTYTYKVVAINGCGITTDFATDNGRDFVPADPGSGTTSAVDNDDCADTGVDLSWAAPSGGWNDSTVGTRTYDIYRGATKIDTVAEGVTTYNDNLGTNNQNYNYTVVAVNGCGLTTSYSSRLATDYVSAAPGGGTAAAVDQDACDDTGVAVSWAAPSGGWNDNGVGTRTYRVYRGASLIATKAGDQTTHIDLGGTDNTTYTYKVAPVNGCGQTTEYSTDDAGDYIGSAPGSGATSAADASNVLYSGVSVAWAAPSGGWNDNGAGTRTYRIYRDVTLVDTVGEGVLSYIDNGGSAETAYTYKVVAVNGCGLSAEYTTAGASDSAVLPENLSAGKSAGNMTLQWAAVSGADRYHIYMGTIGSWYDHDNFSAAGLDNNAVDGSCSEPSNSAAFEMPSGDRYFIICAGESGGEGPKGKDSGGTDRPAALSPCQP